MKRTCLSVLAAALLLGGVAQAGSITIVNGESMVLGAGTLPAVALAGNNALALVGADSGQRTFAPTYGALVPGSLQQTNLSGKQEQSAFESLGLTAVVAAVPEPASLALLGTGLCLVARQWRRRKS